MTNERQRSPRKEAAGGHGVVSSHVSITYPVWKEYGDKLDWLAGFSPHVNVGISRHPSHAAASERTDCWGCHWVYPLEGLDGICTGHPIATLDDLKDYQPPDPDQHTDWGKVRENAARAKSEGRSVSGGTDHGFIFLRLTYLRGFPDFMLDVAENPPELEQLVEVVEDYWYDVVRRWIEAGADTISFGDDLGLQHALPISPEAWRRTIKPSYQRIFSYCRSHGVRVALHSDGYIVDIIPDLIE